MAVRILIDADARPDGSFPDVGGGAVKNEVRNNLARISLRWMIRQCFILKTGILFHRNMFKQVGMEADNLWPKVKFRPLPVMSFSGHPPDKTRPTHEMGPSRVIGEVMDFVSEEEEDLADAGSPINDRLKIGKSWWILEFVPQKIRFQNDADSWVSKLSCVIFLHALYESKLLSQHQPWSWAHHTHAAIGGGKSAQDCKAADEATPGWQEIQT